MPMALAAPTAIITDWAATVAGHSASPIIEDMIFANPRPKPIPARIPITPPTRHRITASTRNWKRISRFLAPMAFLRPISRVRSVTDTSIIFIIPTPPTTRAIAAVPPSITLTIRIILLISSRNCLTENISKNSSPLCRRLSIVLASSTARSDSSKLLDLPQNTSTYLFPRKRC